MRDGGEIVDWSIQQPWSDGRVATFGISYTGTAAEMALINRHPAVKVAITQYAPDPPEIEVLRSRDHLSHIVLPVRGEVGR